MRTVALSVLAVVCLAAASCDAEAPRPHAADRAAPPAADPSSAPPAADRAAPPAADAASSAAPGADAPPKAGDLVFAADFDDPAALQAWTGHAVLDTGRQGARAVRIDNPAGPGAAITVSLPARRLRGCKLLLAAYVKAENVSPKPQPWNGAKFMTPIDSPAGRLWPQAAIPVGTFDWRRVLWHAYVPQDATAMTLLLGLEQVTGKVWFDDLTVTVRRPPLVREPRAAGGPVFKGHDLPRLRGAMVSTRPSDDDLRTLGAVWNANLIRWQLLGWKPDFDTADLAEYDRRLEDQLRLLDAALPLCREVGLRVVVDLHAGPGHWADPGRSLFTNADMQTHFVKVWQRLARRYKDAPAVWAYDLLNEPLEEGAADGVDDWQALALRAARAVRDIDPRRAIIVEPAPWGGPEAIRNLLPLDVPGVVYSVHMYLPHAFTHQGVYDPRQPPLRYPGPVDGRTWDKAALQDALRPVVDFQKAYGVHIYIGEFSAIRWAPDGSASRYLRDCIDLFEAHGWDWSYHAFREWQGWSAEHGPDKADTAPAPTPTGREKLLRDGFAKNKKPAG